MRKINLESIRKKIIGNNILIDTPFGKRHMLYADYTASGRALKIIEDKIQNILKSYANTHTADNYSGQYLTNLLNQAEKRVKEIVNAKENDKIIMTGAGTTAALKRLQEILGVYIPPVTKERIFDTVEESCASKNIIKEIENTQPVVFIGPYEHHTNELMWREGYAEVNAVSFDEKGMIDLKELEKKLQDPKYENRLKLASFSAGSNVTGIRTKVYEIAKICHRNNAFIFFDFAAVAPYVEINMHKDKESYFDAIFFSPHKFLGGPGTSGILIFNSKLYRKDLPPTCAAGGTVLYVGFKGQLYSENIETREKAGTPPIIQSIKSALVLDIKEKIGTDIIKTIESRYAKYFLDGLKKIKKVKILGDIPAENRIPIISFNIKHKDRVLHSRFVTILLNDLFGIQSRAGCSCAGPYGHVLLDIDEKKSQKCASLISQDYQGIKQGWVRVNIHYTLKQEDVDYILKAIRFIAEHGHLFLNKYSFDHKTGKWKYIDSDGKKQEFSIFNDFEPEKIKLSEISKLRKSYFKEAEKIVEELNKLDKKAYMVDKEDFEEIKKFYYIYGS